MWQQGNTQPQIPLHQKVSGFAPSQHYYYPQSYNSLNSGNAFEASQPQPQPPNAQFGYQNHPSQQYNNSSNNVPIPNQHQGFREQTFQQQPHHEQQGCREQQTQLQQQGFKPHSYQPQPQVEQQRYKPQIYQEQQQVGQQFPSSLQQEYPFEKPTPMAVEPPQHHYQPSFPPQQASAAPTRQPQQTAQQPNPVFSQREYKERQQQPVQAVNTVRRTKINFLKYLFMVIWCCPIVHFLIIGDLSICAYLAHNNRNTLTYSQCSYIYIYVKIFIGLIKQLYITCFM